MIPSQRAFGILEANVMRVIDNANILSQVHGGVPGPVEAAQIAQGLNNLAGDLQKDAAAVANAISNLSAAAGAGMIAEGPMAGSGY